MARSGAHPDDPKGLADRILRLERENLDLAAEIEALNRQLEQKRENETRLQVTRNFLSQIINTAPDPVFVKDRNHRFLVINDAFGFFIGHTRESIQGKTSYDIFPREQADAFHRRDAKVLRSGKPDTHEIEMTSAGGEPRIALVSKAPLVDPESGETLLVGIIRDITDQKKAEAGLRLSEAKYRELVESANSIIIRWSTNGTITYFNEFAQSFFGLDEARVVGCPMIGTILPRVESTGRDLERLVAEISEHPERFAQHVNENVLGDDRRVWISWANRGIRDEAGELAEILSVGTDITARVRMEEELREARNQAVVASQAKSEFLANMSHEIRTPLNGVLGMLQLASALEVPGEVGDYIETALESGRNLLTVINDILDVTKIEAGKFDIDQVRFSPRQVVQSVVRTFLHQSRETGIELTSLVADDVPEVLIGDGGRIRQILFNLVGNSMKFTNQGSVSVSVQRIPTRRGDADRLLFTVEDTGIGIPDDKLDYVFDAFTQVDGSYKRKYQGSGLGLGIVKRLIHLMDGTISLDSREGEGTTIAFALALRVPEEAPVREEPAFDPAHTGRSYSVLLAEDNRVNQIMARKGLEKAGYAVTCVGNGAEALNALDVEPYDCVILDIQMPVMDGIEAAQRIRAGEAGEAARSVPLIALTAHAMSGDRERFLGAGMDEVVFKPFDIQDMARAVGSVLAEQDNS